MLDLQELYTKYLANSYRFLGVRNRSEKEMRDYLIKKNAPEEIIEKVIATLYEQKFLDDQAFARSWIQFRARLKPKGKRMLQMELEQKGINKDLIKDLLAEENVEIPDELTQAKALIGRRIEKLKGEPRQVIYQKVGSFLARRGFSWEILKKAIDSVLDGDK